jgi:hypothetical protein
MRCTVPKHLDGLERIVRLNDRAPESRKWTLSQKSQKWMFDICFEQVCFVKQKLREDLKDL